MTCRGHCDDGWWGSLADQEGRRGLLTRRGADTVDPFFQGKLDDRLTSTYYAVSAHYIANMN